MIPENKYLATVLSAGLSETKGGKEQLAIEFGIDEGEQTGQRITAFRSFSDAALPYTIENLRTCGWLGDDLENLASIVGKQVQIVVKHEVWDGKTSAKVKFINSLNGGTGKKLEPTRAQSFAQRMKARIAKVESGEDPRPDAPPPLEDPPF